MNEKIKAMIHAYQEKGDFTGGISEMSICNAEQKLNCNFPIEYREFIRKYGSGGICGVEVLGIENEDHASVVKNTEKYRKLGLSREYIVIEYIDEFIYYLHIKGNEVIRWDEFSKEEIIRYESFEFYLEDSYREAIENLA
ncbi:SMI1/KNR4 family protein [Metabacillus sp. FJAT-52054]|uniref:SMI1/KNR4 family protein n=1 Tax=Metabacillus sediminis TaxID=3117746 RepID=A0ABZ2NGJ4_9BACI